MFIQAQSKSKDMQYRMEITWGKEREDQTRLLKEAHDLTMDLQVKRHINEPRSEKTRFRGFRLGPIQTRLYSHRRWLEAWNFRF